MGAPDELDFAAKARRATWVLVHMPAPAHLGLTFAAPVEGGSIRFPGAAVQFPGTDDPGNPAVLAQVLRRWLLDSETRETWRATALDTKDRLPGWDKTAANVLDNLRG